MRRPAGFMAVLLAVTGCVSVGPPRLRSSELQTEWEGAPATAPSASIDAAWWRSFGDPVLDELIAMAERRNLELRLADARIREARALREGSQAALLPQLNGNAGLNQGRLPGTNMARPIATLGVEASWEVDVFGRLRQESRAADADWAATMAERDGVRLTLAAEVARSYLEYRLYRTQHTIAEANAKAAEETLRIARARFDQGVASRLDVERTLTARGETRALVAQLAELAGSSRHRLYTQGELRQNELAAATESARRAAALARRQYVEGTLSLLEVLDAERTLYALELQVAQATADVSLRLVRLYQTMGLMPPLQEEA
jgi:outer membrane protein TolC